jgi:hypothetical protein
MVVGFGVLVSLAVNDLLENIFGIYINGLGNFINTLSKSIGLEYQQTCFRNQWSPPNLLLSLHVGIMYMLF